MQTYLQFKLELVNEYFFLSQYSIQNQFKLSMTKFNDKIKSSNNSIKNNPTVLQSLFHLNERFAHKIIVLFGRVIMKADEV